MMIEEELDELSSGCCACKAVANFVFALADMPSEK